VCVRYLCENNVTCAYICAVMCALLVFVSAPDQFDLIIKGLPALEPVGFPRECVFRWLPDTPSEGFDLKLAQPY